jgi:hypothetical protein
MFSVTCVTFFRLRRRVRSGCRRAQPEHELLDRYPRLPRCHPHRRHRPSRLQEEETRFYVSAIDTGGFVVENARDITLA